MKKLINSLVILGLLVMIPMQTFAQDTQPQFEGNTVIVSFSDLGFTESDLFSPYDSSRLLFATPTTWKFPAAAELVLEVDVYHSGADAVLYTEGQLAYGGRLDISFNDQSIASINLAADGPQTYTITIPAQALVPTRNDQRHNLLIFLDASLSCEYDIQTTVSIRPTSYLRIPFEESALSLDLTKLPWPFYVRNPLLPGPETLIVVPDTPSTTELQAMLNVAAGFGSITNNDFNYRVVSVGQLQKEQWTNSHLIFVGHPIAFGSYLSSIDLPVPATNGLFADLNGEYADDGVIQISQSPWNPSRAVLVISGNTEEAVDKAAKAFSTGTLLVNLDPRKTLIDSVNPEIIHAETLVEDFYLGDLGYSVETLGSNAAGVGGGGMTYLFNIAKEQVNSEDAFIDLVYNHTGVLDYSVSTITVSLNGNVIATNNLSEETTTITTLHIEIHPGVLQFGENELTVDASLLPFNSCDYLSTANYWFTVYPDSLVHIPATPESENLGSLPADLKIFPGGFLENTNLSDLAFIVPENSPEIWNVASHIAFLLGNTYSPAISDIAAAYGNDVPTTITDERTLIIVGQPSTLPVMANVNDHLPAPFDMETDTAVEQGVNVVYSVPPGESVGYLEMIHSPYNSQRSIMVVSGNDDYGVQLAGNALILPTLSGQISGAFSVTNGTQVAASRSYGPGTVAQESIVGDVFPEAETTVGQPLTLKNTGQSPFKRPLWLIPVILVSLAAVGLILVYKFKSVIFNFKKKSDDQLER